MAYVSYLHMEKNDRYPTQRKRRSIGTQSQDIIEESIITSDEQSDISEKKNYKDISDTATIAEKKPEEERHVIRLQNNRMIPMMHHR